MDDLELVARFLPKDFVRLYEHLLLEEFGSQNLGSSRPIDRNALVGVGRGSGGLGSARSGVPDIRSVTRDGKAGPGRGVVRSELVMNYRSKMDRKLRRLIRETKAFLSGIDQSGALPNARRCVGRCGRFGEVDWLYCPRCSGPMAQIDRTS